MERAFAGQRTRAAAFRPDRRNPAMSYADSSVIVKCYWQEPDIARALQTGYCRRDAPQTEIQGRPNRRQPL